MSFIPQRPPQPARDASATAGRLDLPPGSREPRQRPYKPPEWVIREPITDNREWFHREITTIKKVMHRRFGG
jgi:hypothetical protein